MSTIITKAADLIRETRKEKGLTQKELGLKMGVSESTVNGYESGKFNITVGKLETIFAAMGVTIDLVRIS